MKRLLILALLAAPAAHAAFKCTDKNGRTHFGDTPPAQCAEVTMYEVSPSGTVLRKIDPTLTGEQAKAKQEEEARLKEQAKRDAEQRRKDIALMATYGSEKDIDTSRDLNLKSIEARIKSAKDRVVAVDKRLKQLDEEMEFYRAGAGKTGAGKADAGKTDAGKAGGKPKGPPPQLTQDVERAKAEKAGLEKSIADYQKEMEEVRARYDEDKKRWLKLTEMQREGKLDLRSPQEIEAAKKSIRK